MLAVLEMSDFFWIWLIVAFFAGGTAVIRRPTDAGRLRRIEAKLTLILAHLGLEYQDAAAGTLSAEVRAVADDPTRKIEAIKLYREETGAGLKEAKDAIEAYVAGRA